MRVKPRHSWTNESGEHCNAILPCQNYEVLDVRHVDKSLKLLAELLTVHLQPGQRVPHWDVDQHQLVVASYLCTAELTRSD